MTDLIASLPYLNVQVEGRVVQSNLSEFKTAALVALDGINRNLVTDEDFIEAKENAKGCQHVEGMMTELRVKVLEQAENINAVIVTLEEISAKYRDTRLSLNRLITTAEAVRKEEIIHSGQAALSEFLASLADSFGGRVMLPSVKADFKEAAKGKKTISGMEKAVKEELNRAKLAATETAETIRANIRALDAAGDYGFLFADLQQVVTKAPEDFKTLIQFRIQQHQQKEAERLEAERARIAAEEKAKAERAAADKVRAEQEVERRRIAEEAAQQAKQEARATVAREQAAESGNVQAAAPVTTAAASAPAGIAQNVANGTASLEKANPNTAKKRTSGWEMIQLLATHYNRHESVILKRLLEDMPDIESHLAEEFTK